MRNLDPNYGDNTICDCCGRVFDVRNEPHEWVDEKYWVCGSCVEYYDEEELNDRLLSANFWSAVLTGRTRCVRI